MPRADYAVVNRTCWPDGHVIGDALMQVAEQLATRGRTVLIGQSRHDVAARAQRDGRANGVTLAIARMRADSGASILLRIADALGFALWVFVALLRHRPRRVYVATDPPVVVPFVVWVYASLFRARYLYHLQDIHPEATALVAPVKPLLQSVLRGLDNRVVRSAARVVTISAQMAETVAQRSGRRDGVVLLDNPGVVTSDPVLPVTQRDGLVFCGNAGRLQRIPLLLAAIERYLVAGGQLSFTFVGAGVYSDAVSALAQRQPRVRYTGPLPANEAAAEMGRHLWGLMPIDDQVTRYAFPSKSSSYVTVGCAVLAICSADNAVAQWVEAEQCGLVCEPDEAALVDCFQRIERGERVSPVTPARVAQCRQALSVPRFVDALCLALEEL